MRKTLKWAIYLSIVSVLIVLGLMALDYFSGTYLKLAEVVELHYRDFSKTITDVKIADDIKPFKKIFPLDQNSFANSSNFGKPNSEALIFDSNGDGRLDIYIPRSGQPYDRLTDSSGLFDKNPTPTVSILYVNQGNDHEGAPVYTSHLKLVDKNSTFQKEEMLVENLICPRLNSKDPIDGPGRNPTVGLAVDLNGDGRLDLVSGQGVAGVIWSDPKTQRIIPLYGSPIGRQVRTTLIPASSPLMHYYYKKLQPGQSINDRVKTCRGEEYASSATILINEGDKDHDGLPEWKDVTHESGINNKRYVTNITAADFDNDGDLDLFVGNIMDTDYWPGESNYWAGAENEYFENQLALTGKLTFKNKTEEMNLTDRYEGNNKLKPFMRIKKKFFMSLASIDVKNPEYEYFTPEVLEINGQKGENASITWASIAQDVNGDGYQDLWVANDFDHLKVFINKNGKKFEPESSVNSEYHGNWMGLGPADYNNDLTEDLFAGNAGGGTWGPLSMAQIYDSLTKPSLMESFSFESVLSRYVARKHVLVDGKNIKKELPIFIEKSKFLPPDILMATRDFLKKENLTDLTPYEFLWGHTAFDVNNDGMMDLYFFGNLYMRSNNIYSSSASNPGRLLVNKGIENGQLRFADEVVEHHALNIRGLDYSKLNTEGLITRAAPSQNWSKKNVVTNKDYTNVAIPNRDEFVLFKTTVNDLLQTTENGRSVLAADLNGDGGLDLLIRNVGGYDSLDPKATNLKVNLEGKIRAIPPHHYAFNYPTNFDMGETYVFLNQYKKNNWLDIELVDDSPNQYNYYGLGAQVIVNKKILRVMRSGTGAIASNVVSPLHFGLKQETVKSITVMWPRERKWREYQVSSPLKNKVIKIYKNGGIRF